MDVKYRAARMEVLARTNMQEYDSALAFAMPIVLLVATFRQQDPVRITCRVLYLITPRHVKYAALARKCGVRIISSRRSTMDLLLGNLVHEDKRALVRPPFAVLTKGSNGWTVTRNITPEVQLIAGCRAVIRMTGMVKYDDALREAAARIIAHPTLRFVKPVYVICHALWLITPPCGMGRKAFTRKCGVSHHIMQHADALRDALAGLIHKSKRSEKTTSSRTRRIDRALARAPP